jgi:hypothetical protein
MAQPHTNKHWQAARHSPRSILEPLGPMEATTKTLAAHQTTCHLRDIDLECSCLSTSLTLTPVHLPSYALMNDGLTSHDCHNRQQLHVAPCAHIVSISAGSICDSFASNQTRGLNVPVLVLVFAFPSVLVFMRRVCCLRNVYYDQTEWSSRPSPKHNSQPKLTQTMISLTFAMGCRRPSNTVC